jgi:adenine/guanine phosphoribosyltransferase-like PRPP-binding protein
MAVLWEPSSKILNIKESLNLATFDKLKVLIDEADLFRRGRVLKISLKHINFCTLFGTISLCTVISRIVSSMITVEIEPPDNEIASGFLRFYGFETLLSKSRSSGSVRFITKLSTQKKKFGSRIFHSIPIFFQKDIEKFLDPLMISKWADNLEPTLRQADFFRNGKFSRIISAELTRNIVDHANLLDFATDENKCFGAISMRVMQIDDVKNNIDWLNHCYGVEKKDFLQRYAKTGFVEICVCDPGVGIFRTLENSFKARYKNDKNEDYPFPQNHHDFHEYSTKVIEYAFDELGSSNLGSSSWASDSHALSRIIGLTNSYNGILELYTGNCHVQYRLDKKALYLNEDGIGYKSNSNFVNCDYGTFFQILCPLQFPENYNFSIKQTRQEKRHPNFKEKPGYYLMNDEFQIRDFSSPMTFINKIKNLTNDILSKKVTRPIVFDFYRTSHWRSEYFAVFVSKLGNVLRKRSCIFVEVDQSFANEILERTFDSVIKSKNIFLKSLIDFHRVIPALTTSGELHWIGSPDKSIDIALNSLIIEPRSIENVMSEIKLFSSQNSSQPDPETLYSILKVAVNQYFEPKEVGGNTVWECIYNDQLFFYFHRTTLNKKISEFIDKSKSFRGDGKKKAFLLPNQKKYTYNFLECSRLLQDERFRHEISEILYRMIQNALNGKEKPTLFLCTSAPSLILASSLRKYFDPKPIIADLGHYFDESKIEIVIESIEESSSIVLIQDILSSGKSVAKIISYLQLNNKNLLAVACLFEISHHQLSSKFEVGETKLRDFGEGKQKAKNIPTISLVKMEPVEEVKMKDLSKIDDSNRFWIEPYSLHPFSLEALFKSGQKYLPGIGKLSTLNQKETIDFLEEHDGLRLGHFLFENHHFNLVTRMRHYFETPQTAETISQDIVNQSDIRDFVLIVYPIHSHIRYLIQKIVFEFNSIQVKTEAIPLILARDLGPRSYYLPADKLRTLFQEMVNEKKYTNLKQPINILIVDDSAATGRAAESILRSVYLSINNCLNEFEPNIRKKYEASTKIMEYYAFINRMGRSKSTLFHLFNNWMNFRFSFRCFIEYNVPLHSSQSCHLCDHKKYLDKIERNAINITDTTMKIWFKEQKKYYRALMVDSPSFENLPNYKYPDKLIYSIDNIDSKSAESSVLLFIEKAERGCPATDLLDSYSKFISTAQEIKSLEDKSIHVFSLFVWQWFANNWSHVESIKGDNYFYDIISEEFYENVYIVPDLLVLYSRSYLDGKLKTDVFRKIMNLFVICFKENLKNCQREPNETNLCNRENYFLSIRLFILCFTSSFRTKEEVYKTIISSFKKAIPKEPNIRGDFQGSLKMILDTTIKFLNPQGPSFLHCLKLSSIEMLGSPINDRYSSHANRISTHLKKFKEPISGISSENVIKLKNSVGFLERNSSFLLASIKRVLEFSSNTSKNILTELQMADDSFREIIQKIKALDPGEKIEDIESSWDEINIFIDTIEEILYNGQSEIYKEIHNYNIKIWDIIEEIILESKRFGLSDRIIINNFPDLEDKERFITVFGFRIEVYNFFKNHSIDFLKQKENSNSYILLDINANDANDHDLVRFNIKVNDLSHYDAKRKLITDGHGLRFEKWALKEFGFKSKLNKINLRYENKIYKFELRGAFTRGCS